MAVGIAPKDGAKQKASGTRRSLIIILPLLLVAGSLSGIYFSGWADPLLHRLMDGKGSAGEPPTVPSEPVFYDLPDVLVNLESAGRQEHYIQATISVELASPADAATIGALMPRIIDSVEEYLRGLRPEDLQGSQDLSRIRDDLSGRINETISPVRIKDVLFRQILVQ